MMIRRWPRRGALAACLLLLALGCRVRTPALPTATAPGPASLRPSGAATLQEAAGDLDSDGRAEQMIAYRQGEEVWLAIGAEDGRAEAWRTRLPAGAAVLGLRSQDLNADGRAEVLVEMELPEKDLFGLGVLRWQDGEGQYLSPRGGPSEGSEYFRSQYYLPWVDDLLSDSLCEIIVSVKGSQPQFLDSVVYAWDGQAYHKTELYLMQPRLVPTSRGRRGPPALREAIPAV